LPVSALRDLVGYLPIRGHDQFNRQVYIWSQEPLVYEENVTRLTAIDDLVVAKAKRRAYLICIAGNNSDAVVQ
jgi:hypothetical protein